MGRNFIAALAGGFDKVEAVAQRGEGAGGFGVNGVAVDKERIAFDM